MAMDFPNSPTVGQTFSQGSRTWVWTGTTWDSPTADTNGVVGSAGGTFTGDITAPNYAGRGNAIINGAFDIWQRGTSFSSYGYNADRWRSDFAGTPTTYAVSQQPFTPGNAIAGYEAQYFWRSSITSVGTATIADSSTFIEDVRTLAGQTATISFWAKGDSARTLGIYLQQGFGSGGSATVYGSTTNITLSTAWQRFTVTVNVSSIAGKTIGAGSYLGLSFRQNVANGSVLDLWGVQLEAGSVATPFKRHAPSIQGELAACQRYYWRSVAGGAYSTPATSGFIANSTNAIIFASLPVTMRTAPSSIEWGSMQVLDANDVAITPSGITLNTARTTTNVVSFDAAITGGTTGRFAYLRGNNSTSAYIAASAEL